MEEEKLQEEPIAEEENSAAVMSSGNDSGASKKKGTANGAAMLLIIIFMACLLIWFVFFYNAAPKKVTTPMLESGIVEAITEREIRSQLNDVDFVYYLDDIETVDVDVYMPYRVSQNPKNCQTGSRYKLPDGYGYPVEMSLDMYLTSTDIYGETYVSDPIEIEVSGVIVYVKDVKSYSFRDIEIEYEEEFQSFLDLVQITTLWQ